VLEVRQPHLYKEGDVTHFGMVSGSQQNSFSIWDLHQVGFEGEIFGKLEAEKS
jgi:hypothetical protein